MRHDVLFDGLDEHIDVDASVGRDRDDGGILSYRSLHELLDLLEVLDCLFTCDDIDLVLNDDDPLDTHDGQCHQVLLRLRLRALLIGCDE